MIRSVGSRKGKIRAFVKVLALAWIWVPPLILGFLGYSYLRTCLSVLTSATGPVLYKFVSPGGNLTLRASAVQFDGAHNFMHLENVSALRPDGTPLVKANSVTVQNVLPENILGAHAAVLVEISGVSGTLKRLQNGELEFQRFLPKVRTETGRVAYSVTLVNADRNPGLVHVVDLHGPTPWVGNAKISEFKLDGIGPRWLATGHVALEGAGDADAEVSNDPDQGISIDGRASDLDLVSLTTHVLASVGSHEMALNEDRVIQLVRSFSARSLVVNGPVHVYLPKKGAVSFAASVVANAKDFAYKNDFLAENAHFEGVFTDQGLKGVLRANGQGITLDYTGALSWGHSTVLGGSLNATFTGGAGAPNILRQFLPPNASFQNGKFQGWVAYSGGGNISVSGTGEAASARYAEQTLEAPLFQIDASTKRVTVGLRSAEWSGSQVTGAFNYVPATHAIEGLLKTDNLSIAPMAKRFGRNNLSGFGELQALISGTSQSPQFAFRANGNVVARARGKKVDLGTVVAFADYTRGILKLNRLFITGPHGVATAMGVWNSQTDALDLDIVGNEVPLSEVDSGLTGEAAFTGRVRGKLQEPLAEGRLEVYGAEYDEKSVPLILADVTANARTLNASKVQGFRGASKATGQFSFDFKTHAIRGAGEADDISLSDVIDPKVAGTVRVSNATLGGTLEHIMLHGQVEGKNIVARDVKVDSVKGEVVLNGDQLQLLSLEAAFDQGSATASGTYNIRTHAGDAAGFVTNLGFNEFASLLRKDTTLTGDLSARFVTNFSDNNLNIGSASGTLDNVGLNGFAIGSGPFTLNDNQDQWSGSVSIEGGNHKLDIKDASYDARTKLAQGELDAVNFPLKGLYAAATPYVTSQSAPAVRKASAVVVLPDQVAQQLQTLDGTLNASASFGGKADNSSVNVANLTLSNLQLSGEPSGTIQATAQRNNGIWNIQAFNWANGPGTIDVKGTIAEEGNMNLSGSVQDLNTRWLSLFEEDFGRFTGSANLTFNATGPSRTPTITSKLDYLEGKASDKARRQVLVAATVNQGQISATGTYFADGIGGPLSATLPFEYPLTFPRDKPVTGEIALPSVSLADLAEQAPWIDKKRSSGQIAGDVKLQGTLGHLQVVGQANLVADSLASNGYQTALTKVKADAQFAGDKLSVTASANGSNGGSVVFTKGSVALPDVSDLFGNSIDQLLQNTISGELDIDNLHVVQKGPNPVDAVFGGNLKMSNTLKSPLIAGQLDLLSGSISAPSEEPGTVPLHPMIDPALNVKLSMPNPISVKAGAGQFKLTGDGMLLGSLALLNLDMQLVVDRGSVQLPNARITIDPGGTVHISYRSNTYGEPVESAAVDLAGTTALTANPYANIIQRYDVSLQIRGDLLSAKGLDISAQADPPDLTQDRILMMLGQGGLFQQQLAGQQPYTPQQQLQQAAYTALPIFFNPITQQLATGLGLDYFSIEYDPFEGLAATGAKAIGKNLVLSARREISPPLPGQLVDWDFRLSYRLPFKNRIRDLNLSVSMDEQDPWRLGLEYGWRF